MAKAAKKACGTKAKGSMRGVAGTGLAHYAEGGLVDDMGPLVQTPEQDYASRVEQFQQDQRWRQGHTLSGTQQDRVSDERAGLVSQGQALGLIQAPKAARAAQQPTAQQPPQPAPPPPPEDPSPLGAGTRPLGLRRTVDDGFSGVDPLALAQGAMGQPQAPFGLFARGGSVQDYARGGKVPRGKPGRDTIPAKIKGGPRVMLDNGEYAVPEKATRKIGKRNLDATVLALTGEPPVGYEPGGRVALAPPQGYAAGGWLGRLTGRFDRTAQLDAADAAVSGQTQQAPVQAPVSPPQEAESPGTSMADVMREIRANHPAQQGYAQGGQVSYGPWQPVQGGLEDYVQAARQRAVYGETGPEVPAVSDAQMAARPAPDTRLGAEGGNANLPDPRRMLPPEAWQRATASTDGAGGSSLPGERQSPPAAGRVTFPPTQGVHALPGQPPEEPGKFQRWREGGGNAAAPGLDRATPMGASGYGSAPPPRQTAQTPGYAPQVEVPRRMPSGRPLASPAGTATEENQYFSGPIGQRIGQAARATVGGVGDFLAWPIQAAADAGRTVGDVGRDVALGWTGPTPDSGNRELRNRGLAAHGASTVDIPVARPVRPGDVSNVRQMRPASAVGLDARTMSGVAQQIADRETSTPVAGPNDYITPMAVGAGGKPVYRNLVAPDGQAEYGGAIYSDTVPGASRAGLDQAIRSRGRAAPSPDIPAMARAQQAQARLDLAKQWYGMRPSERGRMPDKVADTLGEPRQPRPGQAQPSIEERKLGLEYAKAGADQADKRQHRAHEQGIKQMELEAGYSKEQRAASTQWDNDLRQAMAGLAKREGDGLPGAAGGGLSPHGQAWALRSGALLRRALPGMAVNLAAGSLYGLAAQVLDQPQALAKAMQQLRVKEPTPEVNALAEQMMRESEQRAQQALMEQFFGG